MLMKIFNLSNHFIYFRLTIFVFIFSSCELTQLAETLQLETSSCLGNINDDQSCAKHALGSLTPGRIGCWSIKNELNEYRELMLWNGQSFTPANPDATARFPFQEGDEVSMRLVVFDEPLDTNLCEILDLDLECNSTPHCRLRLTREALKLRMNMWLGFKDPSQGCQLIVNVEDPESRCMNEMSSLPVCAEEECDGVDNDCDTQIDEGLSCDVNDLSCEDGEIRLCESICGQGIEYCMEGHYQDCDAPVAEEEQCDDFDNDCDGTIDENTLGGSSCFISALGCAGEFPGTYACTAQGPTCVPNLEFGLHVPEVCDGLDNNCDGLIDNHELVDVSCETEIELPTHEICSYSSTYQCPPFQDLGVSQNPICIENPPIELCNEEDDDCDGQVDEGLTDIDELCNGLDDDCDGQVDEGGICAQLVYQHCAVSLGWASVPNLNIHIPQVSTWNQLPPREAMLDTVPNEPCEIYKNIDAVGFGCDTATADSGFNIVYLERRLTDDDWLGVAWDCNLEPEADPNNPASMTLPPEHLEVLKWARESCGVSLGYRSWGDLQSVRGLSAPTCPSLSPYSNEMYGVPRCVRTQTPREYSMLEIGIPLNNNHQFGISFNCLVNNQKEALISQKIRQQFRIIMGSYHNNQDMLADGQTSWGSLPHEDAINTGNYRGVRSFQGGRFNSFLMYWILNRHALTISTHLDPEPNDTP